MKANSKPTLPTGRATTALSMVWHLSQTVTTQRFINGSKFIANKTKQSQKLRKTTKHCSDVWILKIAINSWILAWRAVYALRANSTVLFASFFIIHNFLSILHMRTRLSHWLDTICDCIEMWKVEGERDKESASFKIIRLYICPVIWERVQRHGTNRQFHCGR